MFQGGGIEGHALIFFCESTKITDTCLAAINRRMLKLTKKRYPHPRTKEKPQWDGRRDAIMIKSSPLTVGWVTHKLENSNIKEVIKVMSSAYNLWFAWISGKETWNPQGIWFWSPAVLDSRTYTALGETGTPHLEVTNKTLCTPGPMENK